MVDELTELEQQAQQLANQDIPRRRFGSRITPQRQQQIIQQKQQAEQVLNQIQAERLRREEDARRQALEEDRAKKVKAAINSRDYTGLTPQETEFVKGRLKASSARADLVPSSGLKGTAVASAVGGGVLIRTPSGSIVKDIPKGNGIIERVTVRDAPTSFQPELKSKLGVPLNTKPKLEEPFINKVIIGNDKISILRASEQVISIPERITKLLPKKVQEKQITLRDEIGRQVTKVKAKYLVQKGLELGQFFIPGYSEIPLAAYSIRGFSTAISPNKLPKERLFGVIEAAPGGVTYGSRAFTKLLRPIESYRISILGRDVSFDEAIVVKSGEKPLFTLAKTNVISVSGAEVRYYTTRANEIGRISKIPFYGETIPRLTNPKIPVITKYPSIAITVSDVQIIKDGKVVGTIINNVPRKVTPGIATRILKPTSLKPLRVTQPKIVRGTIEGGSIGSIQLNRLPKKLIEKLGNVNGIKDAEIGSVVTKDILKGNNLIKPGRRTQGLAFFGTSREIASIEKEGISILEQRTVFQSPFLSAKRNSRLLKSEVQVKEVDISSYLPRQSKYLIPKSGKTLQINKQDLRVLSLARASAFAKTTQLAKPTAIPIQKALKAAGYTTSLKELPTSVGGLGTIPSQYAGQGSYEVVAYSSSSLSANNFRARNKFIELTISKEGQRSLYREVPREIVRTSNRELDREIQREVQREIPRLVPREILREVPRQVKRPASLTLPRTKKSSKPILALPRGFRGSSNLVTQSGYKTFVIQRGKKRFLPGVRSKGLALMIGEEIALKELRATFGVEKAAQQIRAGPASFAVNPSQFRGYKIRKGKAIPLVNTFIQRKGKRLSSASERREIQFARRRL